MSFEEEQRTIRRQLDAEIERLKLELHHEKQYAADLITTLRCEAEDKDTEIERLNAEGPWQQIKCPYCLKEHSYKPSRIIREQKQVITELRDALEKANPTDRHK